VKGEDQRIANRSRSATPVAEPQTEARRYCGPREIAARDERAGSVAERARSRGGQGRPAAREAGAESALVTAGEGKMGIIRTRTGKCAGDNMETRMPQRGQFLASRWSRRILVRDEFADVHRSRLRTVCGQFVSAMNAWSRTVETVMRSRMRTVCDRAGGRGHG